jgi:hypothetical protein
MRSLLRGVTTIEGLTGHVGARAFFELAYNTRQISCVHRLGLLTKVSDMA